MKPWIYRRMLWGAALALAPYVLIAADAAEDFRPGAKFPVDETLLKSFLTSYDLHEMRSHAWDVFVAMTQPSRRDPSIPIWETWFTLDQTFNGEETTSHRHFKPPVQLTSGQSTGVAEQQEIRYNRSAYRHIRDNHLYDADELNRLHFDQKASNIPDFHSDAIAVKLAWIRIPQNQCKTIGVWNFKREVPGAEFNGDHTWPDQLWVCPPGVNVPPGGISINEFYHILVPGPPGDTAALAEIRASDSGANQGDYLILAGIHFATRELKNWLWATFWWHNKPELGPYAEGRPARNVLAEPWRHYLMNVAYDPDLPPEPDAKPPIVYNPYVEGLQYEGVVSNCISCHRRSTWPTSLGQMTKVLLSDGEQVCLGPAQIVVRGSAASTATYLNDPFDKQLKLSFLWSLAIEPQVFAPKPPRPDEDDRRQKPEPCVVGSTAKISPTSH